MPTLPNMGLPLPVPGQTGALGVEPPGQSWMELQNAAFGLLDQHTHAEGFGARVPSSGLDINDDLPFNDFNATELRSTRFGAIALGDLVVSDIGCLIVSGVDLYFVDGNGTQIRMTASGALNGTPGSITGLIPPAEATYTPSSELFEFTSSPGFVAGVSCGPLVLGDSNTNGGNAATLQVPTGLAANYAWTLPSGLPVSNSAFLAVSSAGVLSNYATIATTGVTFPVGVTAVGSAGAVGGSFTGGTGSALGVSAQGTGSGAGLQATGGATAGAAGVIGTGGSSGGIGGNFTGTSGSSGVLGTGQGIGAGVQGQGGATGSGGYFTGGASAGTGVTAIAGTGGHALDCTGGVLDMGSHKITSLATPSASTDAAPKGYVDGKLAPSVLAFGATASALGITVYAWPGAQVAAGTGIEASVKRRMPVSGTAKNLYLLMRVPSSSGVITATVRKNGTNTALTCATSSGGTSASDTTNSFSFNTGDDISVALADSGGIANAENIEVSMELDVLLT